MQVFVLRYVKLAFYSLPGKIDTEQVNRLIFKYIIKKIKYMQKTLFIALAIGVSACCGKSNTAGNPEWRESHKGVWTTQTGTPENYNLLNASAAIPRTEALNAKNGREFPIDRSKIESISQNGKTYLRFPLDKEEEIYGLGLNFQSINQRGRILRLHTDHYGGSDNGRTHAAVPFFVSSKGYGVLINTTRYIDVYVGTGVRLKSENPAIPQDRNTDPSWNSQPYSDNLEILVPAEGVEMVMFAGKDMLDVVSRFNLYCGGGFIPPKWGLGFWHRTPTLFSDKDVKAEAAAFAERGFPLDVVGLEPGWHSKAYPCSFEWDKGRFPDAKGFISDLATQNIKVNLWVNPYVAPGTDLFEATKPYHGSHTVWCGAVPDYTIPEARTAFKEHIRKHQLDLGVSGYKMDEVDGFDFWLWPDVAQFPSGKDGEQMRSTYSNLVMSVIDEAYREQNKRTYGLVRAVNAGGVRFPYVIYNDNYSHRDFITAVGNSGFIGVQWTPEVRASRSDEEWLRRMQSTCLSPIAMINAWADGTKPWSFPAVYEECRKAALLRMQLLPYLYSIYAEYYLNGTPPFRAMALENGFNGKTRKVRGKLDATENPYEMVTVHEVKDQYMAGDNIIVAPVFAGQTTRDVVLPKGKWYDFYTGQLAGEDEIITLPIVPTTPIPLFVRDGGIVPTIPAVRQTSEWIAGQPLEIRVYGTAPGTFNLYDDDGNSYDYEKGKYSVKTLTTDGKAEDIKTDGGWSYTTIAWKKAGQ